MKKLFKSILLIAFAAMMFVGCNKEIANETPSEEGFTYYFRVSPETKTVLSNNVIAWEVGDKVGIFAEDTENNYAKISTISPSVKFPLYLSAALSEGDVINCYYPYGEADSAEKVSMSIPVSQKFNEEGIFDAEAMPMVSLPYVTSKEMAEGTVSVDDIYFMMLGGIFQFNIYGADYSTETIQSIEFQADQNIAGNFTFDITSVNADDETALEINGYGEKTITTSMDCPVGATKEDAAVAYMVVAPGSYTGKVIVKTNGADYSFDVSAAKSVARGHVKPLNVNLASDNCTRIEKELVYDFTWDLTAASYESESTSLVTWSNAIATMTNAKGSGTNANNYLGGSNPDSRFYKNNVLTITPGTGVVIKSVVFTTANTSYISSDWTNASATTETGKVTVTPTDGSVAFSVKPTGTTKVTKVQVFYTVAATKSLASISISGDYPTVFNTGDEFSHEGIIVTASYDDNSSADVTADASFTGYDMSTPGNQTVTVSYTEISTTKSATYGITVNAVPMILADDIEDAPAMGGDLDHSYTAQYFTTDDVEVASVSGQVAEAIVAESGSILYSLLPNYSTTAKTGTIVLWSASNHDITAIINVTQLKSSLSVSSTEVIVPYNATSATFTLTTKEMGWNIDVTSAEGMNLSVDATSGNAGDAAQTVTVNSTTAASTSEVLTLGTIVVYRNGNKDDDTQKKTITIKKGQAPSTDAKYYEKVTDISEGKFLFVYGGKAASSFASKGLQLSGVTINDEKILSDATTNSYAITVASIGEGQYTLQLGSSYIGYGSSSTDIATSSTVASNKYKWTVKVLSDGTIQFINVGTTTRYIGINSTSNPTAFKAYATSNLSTYPCPTLYKLSE